MKDALVVLGMHRSGTSSLAGTLVHLGATAPKTLMPPTQHNEQGYFESTRIQQLNDAILESGGSNWADWRAFNPRWKDTGVARTFSETLRETIQDEFEGAPLILVKDPRICRLAPFWFEGLRSAGYTPRALLPVRNPLEVALSLRKRDELPIAHGLLIWLRHVLDAEHASRTGPRDIIPWRMLLTDWRGTVETSSARLNIVWPRLSDFSANEIDRFLSDTLRRQRIDDPNWRMRSEIHEWVRLAHDALEELARTPGSNSALETLDRVRAEFERACLIYGPALASIQERLAEQDQRVHQLNLHIQSLDAGAAGGGPGAEEELRARVRELQAQVAALAADRDAIRAHADRLQDLIEAAHVEGSTETGWTVLQDERAALAEQAAQANVALQQALEQLAVAEAARQSAQDLADVGDDPAVRAAEAEARASELQDALAAAQADSSAARARIDELDQGLAALTRDRDAIRDHSLNLEAIQGDLRASLEAAQARTIALQAELDAARKDQDALRIEAFEADRTRQENLTLSGELAQLRTALDAQTQRGDQATADAHRLGAHAEALAADRDAVQAHSLNLEQALVAARAALSDMEARLDTTQAGADEEIGDLRLQVEALTSDRDAVQVHNANAERTLLAVQQELSALDRRAETAEHAREAAAEKIHTLHEELTALTRDRDAVHAHSLRMEHGLSAARAETLEWERRVVVMQAALDRTEAQRAASRRRARKLLGAKLARWLVPDAQPGTPPGDGA
ncbi:hypothetical protein V5F77_18245 [Xanthobacter sp. DSM 24535]|uniref:hypothetical protein n=1 Tax=Roseixanthobacter psychrophilus TaxID=3119917 RepID=UPI00372B3897